MRRSFSYSLSFLFLFISLFVTQDLIAADVSLAWDHSISPNVAGYKIYVGLSSRSYGSPIVIGYQNTYTVIGLEVGKTYFFAATAFDVDGNESDFSNEVSTTITDGGTPINLVAPTITGVVK